MRHYICLQLDTISLFLIAFAFFSQWNVGLKWKKYYVPAWLKQVYDKEVKWILLKFCFSHWAMAIISACCYDDIIRVYPNDICSICVNIKWLLLLILLELCVRNAFQKIFSHKIFLKLIKWKKVPLDNSKVQL